MQTIATHRAQNATMVDKRGGIEQSNRPVVPQLEGGVMLPREPLAKRKKTLVAGCPMITGEGGDGRIDGERVTGVARRLREEILKRRITLVKTLRLLGRPAHVEPLGRHLARAELAAGGKVIREAKGMLTRPRGRPRVASPKQQVSVRIDADLLAALKATGPRWQAKMNAELRKAMGLKH